MAGAAGGRERVLVDAALDDRLARAGLVSTPLVDPALLASVEAAYWDLAPPGETGIVLDYLREDRSVARRLAGVLEPIWDEVVPQVFLHHYPVYTSFVVKHPGEGSSLFLHRDLCVDDERTRPAFSMWMPLVDTSAALDNGAMGFVPDSWQVRYGGFGPNAVGTFAPYEDDLRARLEPMTVPAGTALIYDARMLHASAPNRSDRPRVAVGCLLARRDHPVVQVVATGRRHRRLHQVDRDYFLDYAPATVADQGMPDRYPVIDEYDEDPPVTTDAVLGGMGLAGQRRVIVPSDLEALAGERHALPRRRTVPTRHDRDVPVVAGDLDPPAGARDGLRLVPDGAVGTRVLVTNGRRRADLPDGVPDLPVSVSPPATRSATLLVLDPGSRLRIIVPRRRLGHDELAVVECPAIRSGLVVDGQVAELDLGAVFLLPADKEAVVWNDGPGPVVAVVRSVLGR